MAGELQVNGRRDLNIAVHLRWRAFQLFIF